MSATSFLGPWSVQPPLDGVTPVFEEVGSNPTLAPGLDRPPGSVARFGLNYYWKFGLGATDWVVNPFSTGGGSNFVATWGTEGSVRWYALDEAGGSDSNAGFSDVSMAAALAVAVRTPAKLEEIIPPVGNGRVLVIAVKSGQTYTTKLRLRGKRGYNFRLIRATDTGANDAAERRKCGAVNAATGPGTGGKWTLTGVTHISQFTLNGTGPAANSLRGYRWRWADDTATVGLRGRTQMIAANTAGAGWTLENAYWTSGSPTPSIGDTGFVEKPGAVFPQLELDWADDAFGTPGQDISWCVAGIACSGAGHGDGEIIGGYGVLSFCDLGGTYFLNAWGLICQESYYTEDDVIVTTGTGVRITGDYQFFNMSTLVIRASAILTTGATHGFANIFRYRIGDLGCIFGKLPKLQNMGYGRSITTDPADLDWNVFGCLNGPGPHQDMLILSGGAEPAIDGVSGCFYGIQADNLGARALEFKGTGCALMIDKVSGATGNTGYGLDLSKLKGSVVILGRETANSIQGTLGQILLPAAVKAVHADFTKTGFRDTAGNQLEGTASMTSGQAFLGINASGTILQPGDLVFFSGPADAGGNLFVKLSDAAELDTARCEAVALNTTADSGPVLLAGPGGCPYVRMEAGEPGELAYLGDGIPGVATDAVPGVGAFKLRIGRFTKHTGANENRITFTPEMLAVPADGNP